MDQYSEKCNKLIKMGQREMVIDQKINKLKMEKLELAIEGIKINKKLYDLEYGK